jgi:hypothetical protein
VYSVGKKVTTGLETGLSKFQNRVVATEVNVVTLNNLCLFVRFYIAKYYAYIYELGYLSQCCELLRAGGLGFGFRQ